MTLRSFFGLVDLVLSAQDKISKAVDWVRNRFSPDETDPIPLTHQDAERIAQAGRRAGHERDEIRPPPKSSSRYD